MKKRIILSLILSLFCFSLNTFGVKSQDGLWEYSLNKNDIANIALYYGDESEIVMPAVIDGYRVKTFDSKTFNGREDLTSVTLPYSITRVVNEHFYDCPSLVSINISEKTKDESSLDVNNYMSIDGVLFNLYASHIVAFPRGIKGEYIMPDSVTSFNNGIFNDCLGLTSITVSKNVRSIPNFAFMGCVNLASVNILSGITSISSVMFGGCTGLEAINVLEDNPLYSSVGGVVFNKDKTVIIAYPIGKKGDKYIMPGGVTEISDGAFLGCASLTSVIIPDSMTKIGFNAFAECEKLAQIEIPKNVSYIGWSVFYGCPALSRIAVDENNPYFSEIDGVVFNKDKTQLKICPSGKKGDYIIPKSVTEIYFFAFDGCSGLTSIVVQENMTLIRDAAFANCYNLSSIVIPDSVKTIAGVINAFRGCGDNLVIITPEGSRAEIYAKEKNIAFRTL